MGNCFFETRQVFVEIGLGVSLQPDVQRLRRAAFEGTPDNVCGKRSVARAAKHHDAALVVVISTAVRNKHWVLRLHEAMSIEGGRGDSRFEQGFRDMARASAYVIDLPLPGNPFHPLDELRRGLEKFEEPSCGAQSLAADFPFYILIFYSPIPFNLDSRPVMLEQ